MTSRAGKEDFHATIVAPQLGIYELFRDFQSVKPPVESLIQLLPRLLVRYYTICSSSEVHRNSIHLAVSVLDTVRSGSVVAAVAAAAVVVVSMRPRPPCG
jgi:sulfite reductase alpha subunit-like flavoprotein